MYFSCELTASHVSPLMRDFSMALLIKSRSSPRAAPSMLEADPDPAEAAVATEAVISAEAVAVEAGMADDLAAAFGSRGDVFPALVPLWPKLLLEAQNPTTPQESPPPFYFITHTMDRKS